MNLAKTILTEAIKYGLRKSNEVNIILAGPNGAGRNELSVFMKKWFENVGTRRVSIFSEDNYYKDPSDIPNGEYGKKLEVMEAFKVEEFIKDVKTFYLTGSVDVPIRDDIMMNGCNKASGHTFNKTNTLNKASINIFTGCHAIFLLNDVLPDSIKIYVNADISTCMERRADYLQISQKSSKELDTNYYENFILPQIKSDILPQIEMADLIIKN